MQLTTEQINQFINQFKNDKSMSEIAQINYLFDLIIRTKKSFFKSKNEQHKTKLKSQLEFCDSELNNLLVF